jgi:hypothetical protein
MRDPLDLHAQPSLMLTNDAPPLSLDEVRAMVDKAWLVYQNSYYVRMDQFSVALGIRRMHNQSYLDLCSEWFRRRYRNNAP